MFSGIIEHTAPIIAFHEGIFTIKNMFTEPLKEGQSIAHDGACMTLIALAHDTYSFFAMEETLRVTNFGNKSVGDTFNVERSLKLGDRLDGHMVSGHIDTVGRVAELLYNDDGSLLLTIQSDTFETQYVIRKGSIALNGVSLTVVSVTADTITVSLIPLTQSWTNLGQLRIGDVVNIEYDMIAKYVANMMVS